MPNMLFHVQFSPTELVNQYKWTSYFDSFDGFIQFLNGGGTIAFLNGFLQLTAPNAANGQASIKKNLPYPANVMTWDKTRIWEAGVRAEIADDDTLDAYISMGEKAEVGDAEGFKFKKDRIQGFTVHVATKQYFDLITGLTPPWDEYHRYKIIHQPANKIEYYIDGALILARTTNIPTGTTTAAMMLHANAKRGTAGPHVLDLSEASLIQYL